MLMSACGAHSASTVHSPATSPSAPAAAAGGPLNCRLPVAGYPPAASKQQTESGAAPGGQPSQKGRGGFIDLPSGKFTPAADSDTSYLAGAHAWVPVLPQAISPDQRTYVQARAQQYSSAAPTTTLYLVQVATRAARLLYTPPEGQMAYVLTFASEGVYVVTTSSTGPGPSELLLIDPATGADRPVPGSRTPGGVIQQTFMAVSGDFAWAMSVSGSQQQPSFKLLRLSLTDGSIVDWYDAPGPYFIVGFDADDQPIVGHFGTSSQNVSLLLIPARNQTVAIQPRTGTFTPAQGGYVRDAHGTWFGGSDGSIWLYTATAGLAKVATVASPGGTGQPYDPSAARSVAGPCV